MIENFAYKNMGNGAILKLNLKGRNLFYDEQYNDGTFDKYFNGEDTGIIWTVENKTIEVSEKSFRVKGLPTLDMEHVIAIISPRGKEYPSGKAYIYDQWGKRMEEIESPKLISDLAKQKRGELPFFDNVHWREIESKYYLVFTIGFNFMWYERRIYDFDKREFGECVGSGRF